LVAAVVTFTVLFVAATIFAIYFGVQFSKDEDTLRDLNLKYHDIATDINSPDVSQLKQLAKSDTKLIEPTALAEAMHQRDELRKMIVASAAPTDAGADVSAQGDIAAAEDAATKAVAAANAVQGPGGAKFSADTLVDAVTNLTSQVQTLTDALKAAHTDRDAARAQAAKDSQTAHDAEARANAAVQSAQAALQEQLDGANDAVKKAQDEVTAAKKTFEDEQHAASVALDSADKQVVDLNGQVKTLNTSVDSLRNRLAGRRIGVEDAVVRRTQGVIVSIPEPKTVYIDLGKNDQIVPGMTFEVYDKDAPLPKLGVGTSDADMPVGVASIEVIKVLDHGSECHVNQVEPTQQIEAGDKLLNLIYDRNTKFNFYVFGDFDVRSTGHPAPSDADIIKRLISQWGGNVESSLNETTDFVVIGAPPDVPVYSPDDLKDPLNEQNLANAKRAAEEYDRISELAQNLHVPIMNQNRFLYFTGYFDLAQR
jgi:hypothetical protein